MAIAGRKITTSQMNTYGVVSAPDRLTGTAQENKQVFDNLIREVVSESVNGVIDDLSAATGASQIGASVPEGLSGTTVQAALVSLKSYTDAHKVEKESGKGLSSNDYTDADKAEVAQIAGKANISDVLTKNNTVAYTPTADYHPATKQYADSIAAQAGTVTSVFGRAGAVTAQAGDYTAQQVGARPQSWMPTAQEVGAATGDASGNASNALKLGNVAAANYTTYETGTWTPGMKGVTTAGTPTFTSSGSYVKIGNMVFLMGNIALTNRGGMAGYVLITGLPFPVVSSATGTFRSLISLSSLITADMVSIQANAPRNGIVLVGITADGYLTNNHFTDTTAVYGFTVWYKTN